MVLETAERLLLGFVQEGGVGRAMASCAAAPVDLQKRVITCIVSLPDRMANVFHQRVRYVSVSQCAHT